MTHSADCFSDFRLGDDKARISDNHLIDLVGYGTLAVAFPGDVSVKLLDVGYVPNFNLVSLMAAHKQGRSWNTTWRRTLTRTTPTRPKVGVRSMVWLSAAGVHLYRAFLGCRSASPYLLQGGVRSYGRRGEISPFRERSVSVSDTQSGVAEYWSV